MVKGRYSFSEVKVRLRLGLWFSSGHRVWLDTVDIDIVEKV